MYVYSCTNHELLKIGSHAEALVSVELNYVTQDDFEHIAISLPQAAKGWDVKHEPPCPEFKLMHTALEHEYWALQLSKIQYFD